MIFRRGDSCQQLKDLISNLRLVMSPYSAIKLQERRHNKFDDFVQTATALHVTHLMILTQTLLGSYLRVTRIPRGPTLSFRILNYTTMKSVASRMKTAGSATTSSYLTSPLVVLNNFSGNEDHKKIAAAIFQNMFPGLDITTLRLANCKRVVLINYNNEADTIDFRHYHVAAVPVGLTKGVRKVIKGKIPDLHNREDIADFVENPNTLSDSEAELPEESRVVLSQNIQGYGNKRNHNSAIKLKELGPRMTLQLVKIVDGLCEGATIYHKYVTKTEIEIKQMDESREKKLAEKDRRRQEQESNVLRKQQAKEDRVRDKEERRVARELDRTTRMASDDEEDDENEEDDEEEIPHDYSDDNEKNEGMDDFDFNNDDNFEFDDDEEEEEEEENEKEVEMKNITKKKFQQTFSSELKK